MTRPVIITSTDGPRPTSRFIFRKRGWRSLLRAHCPSWTAPQPTAGQGSSTQSERWIVRTMKAPPRRSSPPTRNRSPQAHPHSPIPGFPDQASPAQCHRELLPRPDQQAPDCRAQAHRHREVRSRTVRWTDLFLRRGFRDRLYPSTQVHPCRPLPHRPHRLFPLLLAARHLPRQKVHQAHRPLPGRSR